MDVISAIASYAEYAIFSERLRALGFNEDSREGAPLCRWLHGDLVLDVMPLDASILGFSDRWYSDALHAAVAVELSAGLTIRVISAPYFLATKIEAFRGRGEGDHFASHDLEDVHIADRDASKSKVLSVKILRRNVQRIPLGVSFSAL